MNIRPATAGDREAILELIPRLAATGTPPNRNTGQVKATDLKIIGEAFENLQPEDEFLVAEQDGSVIGFIYLKTVIDYYTQQEIGYVSDIVVAKATEGQGVGRALMEAGEEWARSCGYAMMQLNVVVDNTQAQALYERMDYSPEWFKYVKPL